MIVSFTVKRITTAWIQVHHRKTRSRQLRRLPPPAATQPLRLWARQLAAGRLGKSLSRLAAIMARYSLRNSASTLSRGASNDCAKQQGLAAEDFGRTGEPGVDAERVERMAAWEHPDLQHMWTSRTQLLSCCPSKLIRHLGALHSGMRLVESPRLWPPTPFGRWRSAAQSGRPRFRRCRPPSSNPHRPVQSGTAGGLSDSERSSALRPMQVVNGANGS